MHIQCEHAVTAEVQIDQRVVEIQKGEKELSEKEEELVQAKLNLEKLVQPSYHIYDRKTMPGGQGYLMYSNASASIAAVGNIFPVVLYAVAAMVTFTTMTRFVDEERGNTFVYYRRPAFDIHKFDRFVSTQWSRNIFEQKESVISAIIVICLFFLNRPVCRKS